MTMMRPAKKQLFYESVTVSCEATPLTFLLMLLSLHTACDRHGRAVSVLGDLEKVRTPHR